MMCGRRSVELGVWSVFSFSIAAACGTPKRDFRGVHTGPGEGGDAGAAPTETSGNGGSGHGGGAEAEAGTAPMGTSGRGGGVNADAGAGGIAGGASACTAGANRACYASADGAAYPGMPPPNQTTCRLGQQKCEDGAWSSCVGAIGPEAVDTCEPGNDANCNGVPNEGCTCANGKTCSAGTACSSDGSGCKLADGQACATSTDCATSACTVFNLDADKDGYRANATPVKFCGTAKPGYVVSTASKGDDCNDANGDINPGAAEICDGIDNNCNNVIDIAENSALTLSGNPTLVGPGHWPAVASVGSAYAVAYIAGSANGLPDKTYLQILAQTNTATSKVEVDATPNLSVALASDGSAGAGIFYYRDTQGSSGELWFNRATSAGLSGAPAIKVANMRRAGSPAYAAWITGEKWMFAAQGGANGGASWGLGAGFDGTNLSSELTLSPSGNSNAAVAGSGSAFGFVYNSGTLDLSVRNSSFAETSHVTLSSSGSTPVIAARAGGGFAIIWSDSSNSNLWFEETMANGTASCGPISLPSTAYFTSLVPTKRGYLAVGISSNGMVVGQEILAGCSWGTPFSNMGTGIAFGKTSIAAGAGGFAVVWDGPGGTVYSRPFGKNLCD